VHDPYNYPNATRADCSSLKTIECANGNLTSKLLLQKEQYNNRTDDILGASKITKYNFEKPSF